MPFADMDGARPLQCTGLIQRGTKCCGNLYRYRRQCPQAGRWLFDGRALPAGIPRAAANCNGSDPFDRCVFFIDTDCKRPDELSMDSSHHARARRISARRLSAGPWDMRMR